MVSTTRLSQLMPLGPSTFDLFKGGEHTNYVVAHFQASEERLLNVGETGGKCILAYAVTSKDNTNLSDLRKERQCLCVV